MADDFLEVTMSPSANAPFLKWSTFQDYPGASEKQETEKLVELQLREALWPPSTREH